MRKFTIKLPVYACTCKVIFAEHVEKQINKQAKKDGVDPINYEVHGYMYRSEDIGEYYLFFDIRDLDFGTIAHEIAHLIDYLFADRGEDCVTGEPRAYLTGYITELITDYALKNKLIKNKWLQYKEEGQ